MKFFGVFVFVAFLATANAVNLEKEPKLPSLINWNKTINAIISKLPEPIEIPNINLTLNNTFISGSILVDKIEITGLKQLIATAIDNRIFPFIHVDMEFLLPSLNVTVTNYNVDLKILNRIPILLNGNISISIETLEFLVIADASLNFLKDRTLKDLKVAMNMEDFKYKQTGLYNEKLSEFVSNVITDAVAPFVNEYAAQITQVVSPILMAIIHKNKEAVFVNFEGVDSLLNTEYNL